MQASGKSALSHMQRIEDRTVAKHKKPRAMRGFLQPEFAAIGTDLAYEDRASRDCSYGTGSSTISIQNGLGTRKSSVHSFKKTPFASWLLNSGDCSAVWEASPDTMNRL